MVLCMLAKMYTSDNASSRASCCRSSAIDENSIKALQTLLERDGHDIGGPIDGKLTGKTKQALQSMLKAKGYEPGPIDGMIGRKTTRALQQWMRDNSANPGPIDGWWGRRTTEALLTILNGVSTKAAVVDGKDVQANKQPLLAATAVPVPSAVPVLEGVTVTVG